MNTEMGESLRYVPACSPRDTEIRTHLDMSRKHRPEDCRRAPCVYVFVCMLSLSNTAFCRCAYGLCSVGGTSMSNPP